PRVLAAHLPRAALLRLYEEHAAEITGLGLGSSWAEFRSGMAALRAEGMALSLGELDPGVGAAAVPIFNGEDEVVGALALVGTVQRLNEIGNPQLRAWLDDAAAGIRSALAAAPRV
ncbi:MAG TPA: IclR family transcriptional regulator C-terminal domain-containing protein, partial [Burkholderiaceae bacterium]|nr:IclR family transcriptional regulator C-terminal domain-containing protein [Burkholderiaceae bacterium]